ncbi:MAG: T9SS type A sorting domain-containing protein [Bacteroidetes bacterium]|nr:T9SS type A sorting domain-containing protein [Bacteroidota bacterium]
MPNGIGMFVAKYDAATITAGEEPTVFPAQATLAAAYPNPFQGQTTLRYTLAQGGPVRLVVYDVLGRMVAVLVDEVQRAGTQQVRWDAAGVASGVYVARLETGDGVQTQTLTRVR